MGMSCRVQSSTVSEHIFVHVTGERTLSFGSTDVQSGCGAGLRLYTYVAPSSVSVAAAFQMTAVPSSGKGHSPYEDGREGYGCPACQAVVPNRGEDDHTRLSLHMEHATGGPTAMGVGGYPTYDSGISAVRTLPHASEANVVDLCAVLTCGCIALASFLLDHSGNNSSVGQSGLATVSSGCATLQHAQLFPVTRFLSNAAFSATQLPPLATYGQPTLIALAESREGDTGPAVVRIAFTRWSGHLSYAELGHVDGDDPSTRWRLLAVAALPIELHADGTYSANGYCKHVRQLYWLPNSWDYERRHPLLALLHQQVELPGDPPTDHLTVSMVHEIQRKELSQDNSCSDCTGCKLLIARLVDGPWAVRNLSLAHPTFMHHVSLASQRVPCGASPTPPATGPSALLPASDDGTDLLGIFLRPPAEMYLPTPLLHGVRAVGGNARVMKGTTDARSFHGSSCAFVVYNVGGEVTRCIVPGYVESAVGMLRSGAQHPASGAVEVDVVVITSATGGGRGALLLRVVANLTTRMAPTDYVSALHPVTTASWHISICARHIELLSSSPMWGSCVHMAEGLGGEMRTEWSTSGEDHLFGSVILYCWGVKAANDRVEHPMVSLHGDVLQEWIAVIPVVGADETCGGFVKSGKVGSYLATPVDISSTRLYECTRQRGFFWDSLLASSPLSSMLPTLVACASLNPQRVGASGMHTVPDKERGIFGVLRSGSIVAWDTPSHLAPSPPVRHLSRLRWLATEEEVSEESSQDQMRSLMVLAVEMLLAADPSEVLMTVLRFDGYPSPVLLCAVQCVSLLVDVLSGAIVHVTRTGLSLLPLQLEIIWSSNNSMFFLLAGIGRSHTADGEGEKTCLTDLHAAQPYFCLLDVALLQYTDHPQATNFGSGIDNGEQPIGVMPPQMIVLLADVAPLDDVSNTMHVGRASLPFFCILAHEILCDPDESAAQRSGSRIILCAAGGGLWCLQCVFENHLPDSPSPFHKHVVGRFLRSDDAQYHDASEPPWRQGAVTVGNGISLQQFGCWAYSTVLYMCTLHPPASLTEGSTPLPVVVLITLLGSCQSTTALQEQTMVMAIGPPRQCIPRYVCDIYWLHQLVAEEASSGLIGIAEATSFLWGDDGDSDGGVGWTCRDTQGRRYKLQVNWVALTSLGTTELQPVEDVLSRPDCDFLLQLRGGDALARCFALQLLHVY